MSSKTIQLKNRDFTIHGRTGDPYFDHLNVGDQTNDYLIFAIDRHIKADSVVLDIGANIGMTASFMAAAAPSGQVYAFEPGPDTYPHLLRTIASNGLVNLHPYQIALGAELGEADFFENPDSGSASHLSPNGTTLGPSNTKVQVFPLDQMVRMLNVDRVDFIKIDVEGFELDVLAGAAEVISAHKPVTFLEFNAFTLIAFGNQNPRFVVEQLKRILPHVYRFENGIQREITDENSILGFLHDNLIKHGCVDDLLCTFDPVH